MRSKRWLLLATLLGAACDTPAAPTPSERREALLFNGVENQVVHQAANLLYNRVVQLYDSAQIEYRIASGLTGYIVPIYSSAHKTISTETALSSLDRVISDVNRASATDITTCARTELVREAEYVKTLINLVAGGGQPTMADVAPFPHGGWPWGACPYPQAVTNLQLSIAHGVATVQWFYPSNAYHFLVYEVRPDGDAQVVYRLDSDDALSTTGTTEGTRTVTFHTSTANVLVKVDVCGGLNCSGSHVAVSAPAAVTDLAFAPGSGLVITWPAAASAQYYEVTRADLTGTNVVYEEQIVDATSLTVGQSYTYSVRACNLAGCSPAYTETFMVTSAIASPPVPAPLNCGDVHDNRDKEKCKSNNGNHYGQIR